MATFTDRPVLVPDVRPGPLAALLALLPLLATLPAADAQGGLRSTLSIDVQADHTERVSLRFDGLRRLTEYQDICLPERASPERVYDDLGDVPHTKGATDDGRATVTFRARSETAVILMTRAAPPEDTSPFYEADANFCVPEGSQTTVHVSVPDTHELFFVSRGGTLGDDGRSATLTRTGPVHAFYSYQAPLQPGSGLTLVENGPFVLVAPDERAAEAQEVAALAAPALDAAAAEAGLALPWDKLRVLYAPSSTFSWEAGHYGGHGLVTIRQSSLEPDPREGYPLVPVRVLVHEGFHALSAPYGRGDVTDAVDWWLEGTARHAERHATRLLPNVTRHCERGATEARCWDFDDRIPLADLDQAYGPAFAFEKRWAPSLEQSDDARSFYYRYTAYLVGAYTQQHGEETYQEAWARVQRAFEKGEGCPCGTGWLEATLAGAAGGIAPPELYRPYGALYDADLEAFHATVRPFLKDEEGFRDALDQAAGIQGFRVPAPGLALLLGAGLIVAAARRRRA